MSRYYDTTMTIPVLREKVLAAIKQHDDYFPEMVNEGWDEVESCSQILCSLTPKIETDLGKVQFDTENSTTEEQGYGYTGLAGFKHLPNGMPYLGVAAGGDSEEPVFFAIYWDGKALRAYVPNGTYNPKTKAAWGSTEEADESGMFHDGTVRPEIDLEAIKEDIMNRIKPKP